MYLRNQGLWKALQCGRIYTSLFVVITIRHYFYDVQRFISEIWKYISNNQATIKIFFMRTYIYTVGFWRSTWRTYIYVLGCWHENLLVACKTGRGRIYTSLVAEMQVRWVQIERIKDIYIRPWLLEKFSSAYKGLVPVINSIKSKETHAKLSMLKGLGSYKGKIRIGNNFFLIQCPAEQKFGKIASKIL